MQFTDVHFCLWFTKTMTSQASVRRSPVVFHLLWLLQLFYKKSVGNISYVCVKGPPKVEIYIHWSPRQDFPWWMYDSSNHDSISKLFPCKFFHQSFMGFIFGLEINQHTGPRLNIKTVLSTYGDFHVKDKTAVRTSYLQHGNRHTW